MHACTECDKSFGTAHGLKVHVIRAHRGTAHAPSTKTKPKVTVRSTPVSFCPCCGTNIRLVTQALAAIGDLQDG